MSRARTAIFVFLATLALLGCKAKSPSPEGPSLAPDFVLPSIEGQEKSLADFRGKSLMLHFWATWCPPCQEEMPTFQKLYEELGPSGFTIVAINVGESPEEVKKFVKEKGLTFPVLLDSKGEVANRYRVRGLPTTYWIDPSGKIVDLTIGGPLPEDFILENLSKIGVKR